MKDFFIVLKNEISFYVIIFILFMPLSYAANEISIIPTISQNHKIIQEKPTPYYTIHSDEYGAYCDANANYEVLYDFRRQIDSNREDVTVRLHFIGENTPSFIIAGDDITISSYNCNWISYDLAEVVLQEGQYNVYTTFYSEQGYKFVIQQIDVTSQPGADFFHVYVYMSDAEYTVEMNGCDSDGNLLHLENTYWSIISFNFQDDNILFRFLSNYHNYIQVSDTSEPVTIIMSEWQYSSDKAHLTQYGPYFELVDLNVSNQPSDYLTQSIQMKIPDTYNDTKLGVSFYNWNKLNGKLGYMAMIGPDDIFLPQNGYYELELNMMQQEDFDFGTSLITKVYYLYEPDNYRTLFDVGPYQCRNEGIGCFFNIPYHEFNTFYADGDTVQYCNYPNYYLTDYMVSEDGFFFVPRSVGYNNEIMMHNLWDDCFSITNSYGNIISEGSIADVYGTIISPDVYTLDIFDDDLNIADLNGTAHLKTIFDVSQDYNNPPSINFFKIVNDNGVPVDRLEYCESGLVIISASDVEYPDSVYAYYPVVTNETEFFYKLHCDEEWEILDWEFQAEYPDFNWNNGKFFLADLSALTQIDSVAYDLQFYFEDEDGNSCEWTLSPAFVVGDFSGVEIDENEICSTRNTNLYNYPNPFNPTTTISFTLNSETNEDTNLIIYNLKGQKVKKLVSDQQSAGQHSITWNGKDDSGKPVSSGIYFYELKSGNYEKTKKMLLMK